MIELFVEPQDDLVEVQKKLAEAQDSSIRVYIPADSALARVASLKLLLREGERLGKKLSFESSDPAVATMIASLPRSAPETTGATFSMNEDVATSQKIPLGNPGMQKKASSKKPISASFKNFVESKGTVFIVGVLLLLIVGLGIVFGLYKHFQHATITLVLKEESVNKSFDVSASSSVTAIDYTLQKIPAKILEVTESGSASVNATGKSFVGDKATGNVNIFNKTDSEISLPKGTKITRIGTNSTDYVFYLNDAVKIAKQTTTVSETPGGASNEVVYGKATIGVTAAELGNEYNLKKGEKFTVSDYNANELAGENDGDLTGGSKHEAVTITQADINSATDAAKTNLTEKVQQALAATAETDGSKINPETVILTVLQSVPNQKVNDEANDVTVTMQMRARSFSYTEQDLKDLVKKLLEANVSDKLSFTDETKMSVEGARIENEELKFIVKVSDNVVSKVNEDEIKKIVAGRRVNVVTGYLNTLKIIESYKLVITPKLPQGLASFPSDVSKISIEIEKKNE